MTDTDEIDFTPMTIEAPSKPARRTKAHRTCYFWPIYAQNRLPSQAAYDMVMWGEALCKHYVRNGSTHPCYDRAVAALAALAEAKGRYEKALDKMKSTVQTPA